MSLFADTKLTERVEIGDGWVELRRVLTYGDRQRATDAATAKPLEMGGKQVSMHFSTRAYNLALLQSMIVAWSEDAPVNEASIDALTEEVGDLLIAKINEWNPQRTEEAARPLGTTLSDSSEARGRNGPPGQEAPPVPVGQENYRKSGG